MRRTKTETDNVETLARKISKLNPDEQKRVKRFLSFFDIGTTAEAIQAAQAQESIKADKITVAAENALKMPANAPQAATSLDAETLAAIAAETRAQLKEQAAREAEAAKHIIWRCGLQTFTAERAAAAVIISDLFVCDNMPQEEGYYYTRTYNDAANWCVSAYQRYAAPFAVIQTAADDVAAGKILGTYPTKEKANAAAKARIKQPQGGKNKLVYGFVGGDYVAAVPFAVFAATPAIEYAEVTSSIPAYIAARNEIAARRRRADECYSVNFPKTHTSGKITLDVWAAETAASPK